MYFKILTVVVLLAYCSECLSATSSAVESQRPVIGSKFKAKAITKNQPIVNESRQVINTQLKDNKPKSINSIQQFATNVKVPKNPIVQTPLKIQKSSEIQQGNINQRINYLSTFGISKPKTVSNDEDTTEEEIDDKEEGSLENNKVAKISIQNTPLEYTTVKDGINKVQGNKFILPSTPALTVAENLKKGNTNQAYTLSNSGLSSSVKSNKQNIEEDKGEEEEEEVEIEEEKDDNLKKNIPLQSTEVSIETSQVEMNAPVLKAQSFNTVPESIKKDVFDDEEDIKDDFEDEFQYPYYSEEDLSSEQKSTTSVESYQKKPFENNYDLYGDNYKKNQEYNNGWSSETTDDNEEVNNSYRIPNKEANYMYSQLPNSNESELEKNLVIQESTESYKDSYELDKIMEEHQNRNESGLKDKESIINGYNMMKRILYALHDYGSLVFNWIINKINYQIETNLEELNH